MIITDEKEQLHYINKILKEKRKHIYQIRSDGMLRYDGSYVTGKFLAYIDGKWYGARDSRQGTSEGALDQIEKAKFLFAITETRYLLRQNNGTSEYTSPSKPLSEDTVMFFVAAQKDILCLYIIDGNKNKLPLMLGVSIEHDSERIFVQSVIAMTRQYDPDAAKEMEDFWYTQGESPSNGDKITKCRWDPDIDPKDLYDDYPPMEELVF